MKYFLTLFLAVLTLPQMNVNAQYCVTGCNDNTFLNSGNPNTIEYDNMISVYHSTIIRETDGTVKAWGARTAASGNSRLVPTVVAPNLSGNSETDYNYTGSILKFTAGSHGWSETQFALLTTTGLYAWGKVGSLIPSTFKNTDAFGNVATTVSGTNGFGLPTGVNPTDVKMMFGSYKTLTIVTCDGKAFVLSGLGLKDGSGADSNSWQQVKINATTPLLNVVALRGNPTALIALTSNGELYTWGTNTYLGQGSNQLTRTYATKMTLPTVGGSAITPKMIGMTVQKGYNPEPASTQKNSYYLLSTNGELFSLGDNSIRQLGDFTTTEQKSWVRVKSASSTNMPAVAWISPNEHDDQGYGAASALTASGKLYNWGSINGQDGSSGGVNPTYMTTLNTNEVLIAAETGGHTLMVVKQCTKKYGYIGHRVDGSMGDGTTTNAYETSFNFFDTAEIGLCGAPVSPAVKDLVITTPTTYLQNGVTSTTPADTTLEFWTTANRAPGTKVANPNAAPPGTYYAFYIPNQGICTTPLASNPFVVSADPNNAFIYIHKKAVSEVSSLDFNFSLKNSGGTTVSNFILNDQPDSDGNAYDIGNSHGAGEGQLWTILSPTFSGSIHNVAGTLYTRPRESSQWQSIPTITDAIAVDGIGLNSAIYADESGNVFIYNAGVSTRIWNPSSHSNVKIVDVASAGPGLAIAIVGENGSIYKYTGTGTSDSWTRFANVNATASFKPFRLDMRPSTEEIFFISTGTDGNIYKIASANPVTATISTAAAAPAFPNSPDYLRDIAVSNDGIIFTNYETNLFENFIFEYQGGAWTSSLTSRGLHGLTAGVGGQAWTINKVNFDIIDHSIFTRLSSDEWLDDERVRVGHKGNSMMIAIPAGTYKLSEVVPADWFNNEIEIVDPTSNSTFDLMNSEATINVSAGEVVNVVFSNTLKNSVVVPAICTTNFVVDFGFGNSFYGPAQQGFTSYHYRANDFISDGYYTIVQQNTGFGGATPSNIISHTASDPAGKGYFAIFNAAYAKNDFFRQTVTNLIVGTEYEFAFWVADVSPDATIRPNVTMGILNPTNGTILGTVSTGDISSTNWTQYKFNFVATTTTIQIFLKNNSIGGSGNDIAIDDISFRPLPPTIPTPQLQGQTAPYIICSNKGVNTEIFQFTNSLAGGVWSSSDTSKLTINATTGLAVPVANADGAVQVIYTYTHPTGCVSESSVSVTVSANCACYNLPNTATAGDATKHGITLLLRAGLDNGNWPMVRKSAHTVLESNTKGFVITRMTSAQITAIVSPQEGMMVYDTVEKCLKLYDGTIWSCFVTPTCP